MQEKEDMMTDYVLDMAFDAEESRVYEAGSHPMQAGLVEVSNPTTGEGGPQWLTKLKSGDMLHFRLWDISLNAGSVPLNLWVCFFAMGSPSLLANPLEASGPLVLTDLNSVGSSVMTPVHDAAQAGWLVKQDPPLGQGFTLVEVTTSTRYVLQARAQVRVPSGDLRTYVYDPEMVVSPHGG